jgi:hypothetical protein
MPPGSRATVRLLTLDTAGRPLCPADPVFRAAEAKNFGSPTGSAVGADSQQPVLFLVEDLHWIDASTLEWLGLLLDQAPTARLLKAIVEWVKGGKALPTEVLQQVVAKIDGVPLFVEELIKMVSGIRTSTPLAERSACASSIPYDSPRAVGD